MRPILFHIGSFPIHSYGVMLVIAFLIGLQLVRVRAPRLGIDTNRITDALVGALFAGVLGARLTFFALEWPYYAAHPAEMFSIQFAGLTSFGGLAFGLIWMLIWCKRTKTPVFTMMDCIAPSFLIATAIGRVGCLLNGCCYGGVCDASFPLKTFIDGQWHVAAQVYDSVMNLIGLVILLVVEKRTKLLSGQAAGLALVFTGLSRFIYEFSRGGTLAQVNSGAATSEYLIGHITEAQIAALVVMLIGGGIFVAVIKKPVHQAEFSPDSSVN